MRKPDGPAPIQFNFPSATIDPKQYYCAICGGVRDCRQDDPDPGEFIGPDGLLSFDIDGDLCLECAIHLWRAFKDAFPADFRARALELLRHYPITAAAVKTWKPGLIPIQ
jgi:hypothetical protein